MTVLRNSIRIAAPPDRVWSVLSELDALDRYDPGIRHVEVISQAKAGPGSARRCDLAGGGWFEEAITEWKPNEVLAFDLTECTLPVRRLRHSYALTPEGGGTRVEQLMEYDLKYGMLGSLLDAVLVRRKWDAGIKAFLAGLKHEVEAGSRAPGVQARAERR